MTLSSHDSEYVDRCRILIVGVGGGGCNAVETMAQGWHDGPPCLALDTDTQSLSTCQAVEQQPLGHVLTQGLGAGGDPGIGKIAAQEDTAELAERFQGVDVVFLNVALGGGTGTGAAPIIAQTARDHGVLVVCFATMPFHFEGDNRIRTARSGLRDLRLHADAVIVQENDRLLESACEAEALIASFSAADGMLGVALRALWQLLARPGVMNLNFSDLRCLIEGSQGTCALGYGQGVGPRRVDSALDGLLQSPLLDRGAVLAKTAALLVNITGGGNISVQEIEKIMNQLKSLCRADVSLTMGVAMDPAMDDHLVITVLAAEDWALEEEPAIPPPEPLTAEEADGAEAVDGADASEKKPKSRSTSRRKEVQKKMALDAVSKDRFRGVEPTLYEGQDLDVPTFIRKGIRLSK